ncbi:nitroreductase/quinone reductase family protein [Streptomyces sp. PT12]|uniref:nitroreductase/quinone reductase family protein n=1 Tax=Streptomyces sp. PT12 TaxID=1510197 RepID=UPI000DE3AFBC|nr:nitroreductase/quinone reductase family protein [Streptomyces sp. PT12]RBM18707.1 nitroreductase family deazaflavin-dependent oxidoreductase [Streptomyces sp. PT12]
MARSSGFKHRAVTAFQRRILNPMGRRVKSQTLLETTGRTSGQPRRTPVGGRLADGEFWFVSEHGEKSQYIRNIRANPRVRVRVGGRWYEGVATPLPEDDTRARLKKLPRGNSAAVKMFGTDLLSVRVDITG